MKKNSIRLTAALAVAGIALVSKWAAAAYFVQAGWNGAGPYPGCVVTSGANPDVLMATGYGDIYTGGNYVPKCETTSYGTTTKSSECTATPTHVQVWSRWYKWSTYNQAYYVHDDEWGPGGPAPLPNTQSASLSCSGSWVGTGSAWVCQTGSCQ